MQVKKIILLSIVVSFASFSFAQSIEQGLNYMDLEQFENSKRVFKTLLQKEPKNPEYHYFLGELYIKFEQFDSANYHFQEGALKKETYALNYVGIGKLIFEKNPTEGKANFDKALEISKSKDAKVLAAIADFYITSPTKDINLAISFLEKAIKIENKDPKNYLSLGDAYVEKNDGSKAMTYYKQALELNKNSPFPFLKIGKLYGRSRNYNLAIENFNQGLEIDINCGPLYREIGEIYYKARQYSKAIAFYKKYVELTDKNFDTDLRYASFLYFNKDYLGSITILNKLLVIEKNNLIVNRLFAYSLFETGNYSDGMKVMENLWKISNSKNQIASDYEYYGKYLLKLNKDSLAITYMKRAIELDTSKSELYSEIGNTYFLSKKFKEAAEMYEMKISYTEATPTDLLTLGKAYYYNKNYSNADTIFSKFISKLPNSPNGYFWRARANAYLDEDFSKGLAKNYYEKYISLTKSEEDKFKKELIEAYLSIGAYYMQRKDKINADINWKKVKELDPSNKDVDEYMNAKYY